MKKYVSPLYIFLFFFGLEARVQQVNPELLDAAARGDEEQVQKLLAQGVPINIQNEEGKTALIVACELCRTAVVRTLLKRGADSNITIIGEASSCTEEESPDFPRVCATILLGEKPPFVKHEQWTALHFAVDNGKKDCVTLLLKKGKARVDSKDAQGKTPLMVAARKGDLSLVKLLIRHGALVNAQSTSNRSALYYAVAYADKNGDAALAVIKELINNGAEVTDEIRLAAEKRTNHEKINKIITSPASKSITQHFTAPRS